MEALLSRIIIENQELIKKKKVLLRNFNIPDIGSINVLTGIRRCGKTYVLYENAKKYNQDMVLFIDFEDERLVRLNLLDNYDIILDSYKKIYPDKKPIIFFDEVQNLKNWHLYIKRLHVAGYKIFVTGSNAYLLSKDIATFLKGRSIETNIHPFSFKEFLKVKSKDFKNRDFYVKVPEILNLFDEYLVYGAFPEVINTNIYDKRKVIKNIYNLLFYRDIIVRFNKNEYLMKLVVSKISENITKEFSISNLAKKIISLYRTSVPTVTEYFNVLPEPFLTESIYQFRKSFVQRESKRKTYFIDNSFILINEVEISKGKFLENLVFNILNRQYDEIFYYKTHNNLEVDFYINLEGDKKLIQVSYSMSNYDTKTREVKALKKAMTELQLNKSYIFTYNEEDIIETDSGKIEVIPVWKYLLSKQ
ncbi:MAG: ATP-binding protein [Bacteroidota bacterium]|nr:ATP-binding protein [Bacteroidota bacterium]